MGAKLVMIVAAVLLAVVVQQPGEAAIRCTVINTLRPCLPYLTNRGPLGGCCSGVKSLNALARTTADRRAVCSCLKSILKSKRAIIDLTKANSLPKQCGLNIPYRISESIDCSQVR